MVMWLPIPQGRRNEDFFYWVEHTISEDLGRGRNGGIQEFIIFFKAF
jgi:hypothetical protein